MNQFTAQIGKFLQQYTMRQRIIIFAVLIGFISSLIALMMWANRPEYEVLYSNIEPASASTIVSDLREQKIKFQLENGGRTIYVPKENVSELRLKYAKDGTISDGIAGYEIFEKSNMGMTTFMQQLNMRRALEGELTRTINQFPEVTQSRVHLVVPGNRLFEKDKRGSASVVLYLKPGHTIADEQVSGIAALVANSVKGIEAEDVVVLDTKGKLLSEKPHDGGVLGVVGNQWELQSARERELQHKVTDIVEGVVGYQNAVVKVSAQLNFDQIERTQEKVDPDQVTVLSEEKYNERSNSNMDSSNFNADKSITNYDYSKTKEHFIANTGDIKRLTVAVLVNGTFETKTDPETEEKFREYTPRTQQELDQISQLVKTAVGFSEDRGDLVTVENMRFDDTMLNTNQEYIDEVMKHDWWEKLLTRGLIGVGLLLAFFLIKGLLKSQVAELFLPQSEQQQLAAAKAGNAGVALNSDTAGALQMKPEIDIPEDMYIAKLSPEARAKLKAKDKMTEEVIKFAQSTPEDASMLIRSWLMQGKQL